jgi:Nucleotidyl transferase of unknown function (DUF2204)
MSRTRLSEASPRTCTGAPARPATSTSWSRRGTPTARWMPCRPPGFRTEKTDPSWIYKAVMDGVLVDVIFKVKAGVYLDDEVRSRVEEREYRGQRVRLVSPEDAVIIEALSDDDQARSHWFNALAILAASAADLDWDYLERRARYGARRALSLLLYAQSNDYVVPERIIRDLFDAVFPPRSEPSGEAYGQTG